MIASHDVRYRKTALCYSQAVFPFKFGKFEITLRKYDFVFYNLNFRALCISSQITLLSS